MTRANLPTRPSDHDARRAILRRRLRSACGLIALCALAVLFLMPLLWAASASLKSLDKVNEFPPRFIPDQWLWSNYVTALTRLPFLLFIGNSLVISVAATIGQVLTASMVGYAFARLPWRGRAAWFIVLLATMMLPAQVVMITQYLIYKELGWVNTWKPLIVPFWLGGGAFFVFLFRQFFKGIPKEMEEAARLDGASEWQLYWQIFLPNAKPVIATAAVMGFIAHWKEFLHPLIYLSDFRSYPTSIGLHMYQSIDGAWTNYLMAAALVTTLPLIVLFAVGQRFLVKGMLLTGSKG